MTIETIIQNCLTCGKDFTWKCDSSTLDTYFKNHNETKKTEGKFVRLHQDYCTPCTEVWEKEQMRQVETASLNA